MSQFAASGAPTSTPPVPEARARQVADFARSELFERTFQDGMTLVEETAAYLDGDGRREAKLLSRAAALAYAAESMGLTTRLMQAASWLLVQRAVREGDMAAEQACDQRYRLKLRPPSDEPTHPDLPIALIELMVRAEKLLERVVYLDRRMFVDTPDDEPANPVQNQLDRLKAAFGG
jgi:regulator of CtrA degradation